MAAAVNNFIFFPQGDATTRHFFGFVAVLPLHRFIYSFRGDPHFFKHGLSAVHVSLHISEQYSLFLGMWAQVNSDPTRFTPIPGYSNCGYGFWISDPTRFVPTLSHF